MFIELKIKNLENLSCGSRFNIISPDSRWALNFKRLNLNKSRDPSGEEFFFANISAKELQKIGMIF